MIVIARNSCDEAIQSVFRALDCFASLAMTGCDLAVAVVGIPKLGYGRQDYEARFVLVRPDQYVAWVGDAEPADAAAIICRAAGLDAA